MKNLNGVTLFVPFLSTNFLKKAKKFQFLSKNGGIPYKNEEICSQK